MDALAPSGETHALVPTTMAEAMQLANMMAGAKLVPAALQKSPADCLMVIQQAVRWQMDPFAVAQECSVIQGKLMHSGKLVAAVINARGNLVERLSYAYWGEGDDRTVTVSGKIQGEIEARTVMVRLGNAKTSNKVWQTQPDQQLMYHGARVWARRHAPELMLGVYSPEEFDEAPSARRPPQAAPNVMRAVEPPHDSETGEVLDESESSPPVPHQAVSDPQPATGAVAAEAPALRSASDAGATPDVSKLDAWLGSKALLGSEALDKAWDDLTNDQRWEALTVKQRQGLEKAFYRRHQVTAANVDQDTDNDLAARE